MTIAYDRRPPDHFLAAFESGAAFDALRGFAATHPLLDLQFRGAPGEKSRATLYFGLTKLIDIYCQRRLPAHGQLQFKVKGHQGRVAPTKFPDVPTPASSDQIRELWPKLELYLHELMESVATKWTEREGKVQSMLLATGQVGLIDREVVLRYSNHAERQRVKSEVIGPYEQAFQATEREAWQRIIPKFGNELDLLAVDAAGRVLLIELKPASEMHGIAWAPAQVSVYLDLFRRWVSQGPEAARDILNKTLEQRQRLGLPGLQTWMVASPIRMVPVVAIGGDNVRREALSRLRAVQETLIRNDIGHNNLEIWQQSGSELIRQNWKAF